MHRHVKPGASSQAAANRRGILFMASGMACLVLNDTVMKYVGQSLGVAQMLFVRGTMAVLMILAVARATGATRQMRTLVDRRIAQRTIFESLGTLLYIVSLMHLPIGNATAINLSAPLMMALLAVFVLGERPGFHRWLAIGAGFVGVVLVIQPRIDDFNTWALACLAGTFSGTLRDLMTRRIPSHVPAILITLTGVSFVTLLAGLYTLSSGWQPMRFAHIGLLAIAAVLLAVGYFLIVNCMRHGEVSVVAPFRYSGLLVALTTGFIIWGDVPSAMAWSGIALLLVAGIYLLHDERRRNRLDEPIA